VREDCSALPVAVDVEAALEAVALGTPSIAEVAFEALPSNVQLTVAAADTERAREMAAKRQAVFIGE